MIKSTLMALLAASGVTQAEPFTYQGKLDVNNAPASGLYDFRFRLLDASNNQVALYEADDIPTSNGVFTVDIDFGTVFDGASYWLEVGVRPGTSIGNYTTLSPLQPISATPVAQVALTTLNGAGWSLSGNSLNQGDFLGSTNTVPVEIRVNNEPVLRLYDKPYLSGIRAPNVIVGNKFNSVSNNTLGATISGGGGNPNISTCGNGSETCVNQANGNFSTVGGGWGNIASGDMTTVAGGNSNTTGGNYASIGGGIKNVASAPWSVIAGGRLNRTPGDSSTIGGGTENTASGVNATIGGGAGNNSTGTFSTIGGGALNVATGDNTTVGGGYNNQALQVTATVAGGYKNRAQRQGSTVCGGTLNVALGNYATVCGGTNNQVEATEAVIVGGSNNVVGPAGEFAMIAAGRNNSATGLGSFVPAGSGNYAGGDFSFAGGLQAKVRGGNPSGTYYSGDPTGDEGTFIWADATNTPLVSSGPNRFMVRATGGIWFGKAGSAPNFTPAGFITTSTGAYLSNGGTWVNSSDASRKENFRDVDEKKILAAITKLKIQQWNYKEEDDDILHIGPTAQAFHAAFGLGENDKNIATVDADGVALVGIQALARRVKELETLLTRQIDLNTRQAEHIQLLQTRLEAQARQLNQLQTQGERLARLEQLLAELTAMRDVERDRTGR